jgi:magnesium chelatase accessory protein
VAPQAEATRRPDRSGSTPRRMPSAVSAPILPPFWPHRQNSRFIRAGGVQFHVQEWPSKTSGDTPPTILLLHGTGASTHSFAALAPLLAERARVIAIDLPGHGFSETTRSDLFTLPGMADAIAALLRQCAINPVLAIGHSAGAAILIRLALDHVIAPEAIVALNGAILPLHPFSHPFVSLMAKFLAANPFVPWFFSRQANRTTVERLLRDTGSNVPADSRAGYEHLLQTRRHVAAALRMMASWDLETLSRDLPQLATKLVLVAADADKTIPPQSSAEVARRAPHAELHRLPRLGHLAHEEDPQTIATLILSLLPAASQPKAGTP